MKKPLIIVSGSNGQLGSELKKIASKFQEFIFVFANKNELDLFDFNSIKNFFQKYQPGFFINCAAYTAVDKAEQEKEKAYRINAEAVGEIAKLCEENQSALIHFSTDYVFNGQSKKPYEPDDETSPINYYGYTKLQGEKFALENCSKTIIIRTSWVYSEFGHNFVKTMLRLMKEKKEINVVNDQFGSPTYAADLAEAVMEILKSEILKSEIGNRKSEIGNRKPKIFHYSNSGVISWYDFAIAIKNEINSSCIINPISTLQYPTPAKRPHFSFMNTRKVSDSFNIPIKNWQDSLRKCLRQLKA
ncbi:MAG: dTDP-4-dehydrorhamnose reductase [Chitinophagaceae bacterium]